MVRRIVLHGNRRRALPTCRWFHLVFYPLPTPTRAQVADVARRTADRIEKLLRKAGRSLDPEMADDSQPQLALDEPGLAACYSAAAQGLSITGDRAGQPPLRLITSREPTAEPRPDEDVPAAEVRGVNVYAKQVVDGRDRRQLERLCKYITRPPSPRDGSSGATTESSSSQLPRRRPQRGRPEATPGPHSAAPAASARRSARAARRG